MIDRIRLHYSTRGRLKAIASDPSADSANRKYAAIVLEFHVDDSSISKIAKKHKVTRALVSEYLEHYHKTRQLKKPPQRKPRADKLVIKKIGSKQKKELQAILDSGDFSNESVIYKRADSLLMVSNGESVDLISRKVELPRRAVLGLCRDYLDRGIRSVLKYDSSIANSMEVRAKSLSKDDKKELFDYLAKPFLTEILKNKLLLILDRQRTKRPLAHLYSEYGFSKEQGRLVVSKYSHLGIDGLCCNEAQARLLRCITPENVEQLKSWSARKSKNQSMTAMQAKVILSLLDGDAVNRIKYELQTTRYAIMRILDSFVEDGIDGIRSRDKLPFNRRSISWDAGTRVLPKLETKELATLKRWAKMDWDKVYPVRAEIVLSYHNGVSVEDIVAKVGREIDITNTVTLYRKGGLEALKRGHHSSEKKVSAKNSKYYSEVKALLLTPAPEDSYQYGVWSCRGVAEKLGISKATANNVMRALKEDP